MGDESVYIETSIVSYLTARPSPDLVGAARQQLTHDWWDGSRAGLRLWISELVLEEARQGDRVAAEKRIQALAEIPLLPMTPAAEALAALLLERGGLPAKAAADALHIAVATVNRIDYLLTWNCTHIANPFVRRTVRRLCAERGYETPTICTPEEFIGG